MINGLLKVLYAEKNFKILILRRQVWAYNSLHYTAILIPVICNDTPIDWSWYINLHQGDNIFMAIVCLFVSRILQILQVGTS